VCDGTERRIRFRGLVDLEYGLDVPPLDIVECPGCGLLSLDPMPSAEVLNGFYTPDYANIRLESEGGLRSRLARLHDRRLVRRLARLAGPQARVLDVGCSAGQLLGAMKEMMPGWRAEGLESAPAAVEAGRARGRDIFLGTLDRAPFAPESFDFVVLNHVIEHVPDPAAMLRGAARLLRPGGSIYVETPNIRCLDFRLFGRYWGGIHFPRHTVLFSDRNILPLFRACGFDDARIEPAPLPFGWAMGVQNLMVAKLGLRPVGGRIPGYPLVLLAVAPIVLLQGLFGSTAAMAVTARRRP
jgi:SAM-dependent methyltransferase